MLAMLALCGPVRGGAARCWGPLGLCWPPAAHGRGALLCSTPLSAQWLLGCPRSLGRGASLWGAWVGMATAGWQPSGRGVVALEQQQGQPVGCLQSHGAVLAAAAWLHFVLSVDSTRGAMRALTTPAPPLHWQPGETRDRGIWRHGFLVQHTPHSPRQRLLCITLLI